MTRWRCGATPLVAVLLWLLASAVSPAWGATTSLQVSDRDGQRVARLSYFAAPGEANAVEIRFDWSEEGSADQPPPPPGTPPKAYVVTEREHVGPFFKGPVYGVRPPDASLLPGPGCNALTPASDGLESVRCPIPVGARALGPIVDLGDRGDGVRIVMVEPDTKVYGRAGPDSIDGVGWMYGGPGDDEIAGGGRIFGGHGQDTVGDLSDSGRRSVRTLAEGDDWIDPGPGGDFVDGGGGDDVIRARHGDGDILYCSEGRDTVTADVEDWTFLGCERVRRARPPRIIPTALWWSVLDDHHVELQGWCPSDGPPLCVGQATLRLGRRLLGTGPIRLRRGRYGFASVRIGWPTVARLDGRRLRVTVRSYDPDGKLRSSSRTLRLINGDEEGDGD